MNNESNEFIWTNPPFSKTNLPASASASAPLPLPLPALNHQIKDLEAHSLLCPCCGQFYDVPVTLRPCHHTFCSRCIRRHLCANNRNGVKHQRSCPVCNAKIEIRKKNGQAKKLDDDEAIVPNHGLQVVVDCYKVMRSNLYDSLVELHSLRNSSGKASASMTMTMTKSDRKGDGQSQNQNQNEIKKRISDCVIVDEPASKRPRRSPRRSCAGKLSYCDSEDDYDEDEDEDENNGGDDQEIESVDGEYIHSDSPRSGSVIDLTESKPTANSTIFQTKSSRPKEVVRLEAKNFSLTGKNRKELVALCHREGIDATGTDGILKDRIKRFADHWSAECDRAQHKSAQQVVRDFRTQEAKRATGERQIKMSTDTKRIANLNKSRSKVGDGDDTAVITSGSTKFDNSFKEGYRELIEKKCKENGFKSFEEFIEKKRECTEKWVAGFNATEDDSPSSISGNKRPGDVKSQESAQPVPSSSNSTQSMVTIQVPQPGIVASQKCAQPVPPSNSTQPMATNVQESNNDTSKSNPVKNGVTNETSKSSPKTTVIANPYAKKPSPTNPYDKSSYNRMMKGRSAPRNQYKRPNSGVAAITPFTRARGSSTTKNASAGTSNHLTAPPMNNSQSRQGNGSKPTVNNSYISQSDGSTPAKRRPHSTQRYGSTSPQTNPNSTSRLDYVSTPTVHTSDSTPTIMNPNISQSSSSSPPMNNSHSGQNGGPSPPIYTPHKRQNGRSSPAVNNPYIKPDNGSTPPINQQYNRQSSGPALSMDNKTIRQGEGSTTSINSRNSRYTDESIQSINNPNIRQDDGPILPMNSPSIRQTDGSTQNINNTNSRDTGHSPPTINSPNIEESADSGSVTSKSTSPDSEGMVDLAESRAMDSPNSRQSDGSTSTIKNPNIEESMDSKPIASDSLPDENQEEIIDLTKPQPISTLLNQHKPNNSRSVTTSKAPSQRKISDSRNQSREGSKETEWQCNRCTFLNKSLNSIRSNRREKCMMCDYPRK